MGEDEVGTQVFSLWQRFVRTIRGSVAGPLSVSLDRAGRHSFVRDRVLVWRRRRQRRRRRRRGGWDPGDIRGCLEVGWRPEERGVGGRSPSNLVSVPSHTPLIYSIKRRLPRLCHENTHTRTCAHVYISIYTRTYIYTQIKSSKSRINGKSTRHKYSTSPAQPVS